MQAQWITCGARWLWRGESPQLAMVVDGQQHIAVGQREQVLRAANAGQHVGHLINQTAACHQLHHSSFFVAP